MRRQDTTRHDTTCRHAISEEKNCTSAAKLADAEKPQHDMATTRNTTRQDTIRPTRIRRDSLAAATSRLSTESDLHGSVYGDRGNQLQNIMTGQQSVQSSGFGSSNHNPRQREHEDFQSGHHKLTSVVLGQQAAPSVFEEEDLLTV